MCRIMNHTPNSNNYHWYCISWSLQGLTKFRHPRHTSTTRNQCGQDFIDRNNSHIHVFPENKYLCEMLTTKRHYKVWTCMSGQMRWWFQSRGLHTCVPGVLKSTWVIETAKLTQLRAIPTVKDRRRNFTRRVAIARLRVTWKTIKQTTCYHWLSHSLA